MYVKVFPIKDEKEVNEFLNTVVLVEDGAVQVTSENTIVVFYRDTKKNYETSFVGEMLEGLKRNLFHETIRKASLEAEFKAAEKRGTNYPEYDAAKKKLREAEQNITMFELKIKALEEWKAKPTSTK